ncbi:uncharacterized protein BCR38DRAFT_489627 [Pseudomassariella vexata]|uniref:Rhodopsin domain-containing protein n=1 Tax=Pseudomassariella vexata TaxID=1141098 RepID=A0A1Y2DG16_9PEZI|nr:uncharacterized protein BCR38DRAFT_489627 [Pseudomassariella vexata]ORY58147.1 hypothetical protein BCR38DRAFT_489627 [Pseudomassariella vexata]
MLFPVEKTEQVQIIAACVVLSVLPVTAVGLRILARKMAYRVLDMSDWFIMVSCLLVIGHWIEIMCACLVGGMGYMGLADLTKTYGPGPVSVQKKIEFASIFIVLASGCFYKLSVLALYTKILPFPIIAILTRVIAAMMLVWYTATWVGNIFIVQPVAANWDFSIPITWQGDIPAFARSIDAMTIVTDIAILVLPFKYLMTLRMPFWSKTALLFAFSLGILTVIISIIRLYLTKWDSNIADDLTVPFIWEGLEPSIGIIAACIPTLRPLLGRGTYSTGTMQLRPPATRRTPKSFETRVLDDIDKDTSTLIQLRPTPPDHSTNVMSEPRVGSGETDREGLREVKSLERPGAIHVKTEWSVSEE